jgi:hypothetical protein
VEKSDATTKQLNLTVEAGWTDAAELDFKTFHVESFSLLQ